MIAVLFSVIGAFYYLRVIKLMYFDKAIDTEAVSDNPDFKLALSLNGLAVLGLGLFPGLLMAWCVQAIS